MGKTKERRKLERKRLFDLYSRNWGFVKQHLDRYPAALSADDIYVCPICLHPFPGNALLPPQRLTLEHIPPQSVGGKESGWILLCSDCNNRQLGSRLDSELAHRTKVMDFMNGVPGASAEATLTLAGDEAKIPAELTWSAEGRLHISDDTNPKRSPPDKIAKHEEQKALFEETRKLNAQFSVILGKRPYWEVAFLRIAYLMVFRLFGYGVLVHPNMQRVREQILNPDDDGLPRTWILEQVKFSEPPLGVNIIREPKELVSFLVVVELATKLSKSQHAIILPAPNKPGLDVYTWLKERPRDNGPTFTGEAIASDPAYITDPALCLASDTLWQN